ncbi:hypothetical protein SAICODRAFT_28561 [Saitoella complicata NRRL Y-17804]|uniref:uncharacterized protein n=1 Tax=Saitoella complicata (strain BCRC 22490 / CBS 7301 / JCM 7358 / NBRC 10748 / NRRL Y-17804) TaxID=698492 RepID=UPI000866EFEF|nr:uncharacterized protein SAICODRAFT_28561 [Saitoella complicata NRRL Y-17804]ODQ56359.1 hypothetical protein SAICODRAFT_28561 [Saitoella complicata NRRL Y-17804]
MDPGSDKTDTTSTETTLSQPPPPPPIIHIYPEEFIPSAAQSPSPFAIHKRISQDLVLLAAYAAAGAVAGAYAVDKLVLKPMINQLTEARRDFHRHAIDGVSSLNEQLTAALRQPPLPPVETEEVEVSGEGEGPKFVDASTQTSTQIQWEINEDALDEALRKTDGLDFPTPAKSLQSISETLPDIAPAPSSLYKEMSSTIDALREYLKEEITKNAYPTSYGGFKPLEGDDLGSKVKSEIRSVKGMLLNIRNFPGAGTSRLASLVGV